MIWTASKLEHAVCERLWFYENLYSRKRDISFNRAIAVGIFLHKVAEGFWVKDKNTGLIRPKYKDPKAFYRSVGGEFKYNVIRTGEIQERRIEWKDEEEKWRALGEVYNISRKFYEISIKDGPPLLVEQEFKFRIEGINFSGRIDDIRKDPTGGYLFIIRDHKSGRRYPRQMELEYKAQFTLYVLGVGCLIHGNKELADLLGVNDEERRKWAGNPVYLDDRIKVEYHHMRTGETFTTTRIDTHYHDFMQMVRDVDERIRGRMEGRRELFPRDFPPNRRHCDYCYASEICDDHTRERKKPDKTLIYNESFLPLESEERLVVVPVKLGTIQPRRHVIRRNRRQKSLNFE